MRIPLTAAFTAEPHPDNVDFFIGCSKDSAIGRFFMGTLDEFVIYTRALDAVELAEYVRRTRP